MNVTLKPNPINSLHYSEIPTKSDIYPGRYGKRNVETNYQTHAVSHLLYE